MIKHIILIALAALGLASCGHSNAGVRLDAAEMSLSLGDADDARRGVELLMNSADTAYMTAEEMCRAALVYAALSDDHVNGSETDAAMAARYIAVALRMDTATVDSLMQALPVEQRAQLAMVRQLSATRAVSTDFTDFEEGDSLLSEDYDDYHE